MDGGGRLRHPVVLGDEAPANEPGRQAGCDRSRYWAIPEVVTAVGVRVGCAAAAGPGGGGHAGSDGEGVERQAPEDFLVLVDPGQAPQVRQQRCNRRAVGLRAGAVAAARQRFKTCKPLLPLLMQAAELQLRAVPHSEVNQGEGLLLPLPAPAAKQSRVGFSLAGGSIPVAPGRIHSGGRQRCYQCCQLLLGAVGVEEKCGC
jgi:hypothetical protein